MNRCAGEFISGLTRLVRNLTGDDGWEAHASTTIAGLIFYKHRDGGSRFCVPGRESCTSDVKAWPDEVGNLGHVPRLAVQPLGPSFLADLPPSTPPQAFAKGIPPPPPAQAQLVPMTFSCQLPAHTVMSMMDGTSGGFGIGIGNGGKGTSGGFGNGGNGGNGGDGTSGGFGNGGNPGNGNRMMDGTSGGFGNGGNGNRAMDGTSGGTSGGLGIGASGGFGIGTDATMDGTSGGFSIGDGAWLNDGRFTPTVAVPKFQGFSPGTPHLSFRARPQPPRFSPPPHLQQQQQQQHPQHLQQHPAPPKAARFPSMMPPAFSPF